MAEKGKKNYNVFRLAAINHIFHLWLQSNDKKKIANDRQCSPNGGEGEGETEIPDVGGNTGSGVRVRSHASSATN